MLTKDFFQNGSKESTPDVCPEYRRNVCDSSDESSTTPDIESGTGNGIQEAETEVEQPADTAGEVGGDLKTESPGRLEKKFNPIESSTDTHSFPSLIIAISMAR